MGAALRSTGCPHHLSCIVDVEGDAICATQRAKVPHAHAIGTRDESTGSTCGRVRPPHYLPGGVDAPGRTPSPTQSSKLSHPRASGVSDESTRAGFPYDLSGFINIDSTGLRST